MEQVSGQAFDERVCRELKWSKKSSFKLINDGGPSGTLDSHDGERIQLLT